MPDTDNIIQRQEDAFQRIAKALNLEAHELRGEARGNPPLARAIEMENIADALETSMNSKFEGDLRATILASNDAALNELPGVGEKSAVSLREWAKQNAESTATETPPTTIETVRAEPMQMTETVEVKASPAGKGPR